MVLTRLLTSTCAAGLLVSCASPMTAIETTGATLGATDQALQVPAIPWAFEGSDITPDPAYRYGILPNGMRYVLRKNDTPPNEATMLLRIGAGSLVEKENQLGLAHFIEHMVFNGTRNVPEGEFVRAA